MKTDLKPKYKRIVLKLSGEALAGDKGFGLDEEIIAGVVDQLIRVHDMGVEIGIVIGGGNFWRGRQGTCLLYTSDLRENAVGGRKVGKFFEISDKPEINSVEFERCALRAHKIYSHGYKSMYKPHFLCQ